MYNRQILLTSLFVLYNLTFTLVDLGKISAETSQYVISLNLLFIGFYSVFMLMNVVKPQSAWINRTPFFLITVCLAFGLNGLFQAVSESLQSFHSALLVATPIFVALCLIVIVSINIFEQFNYSKSSFTVLGFIGIVVLSYCLYFEDTVTMQLFVLNAIFVVFSIIQVIHFQRHALSSMSNMKVLDPLDQFSLTAYQKEITQLILEDKSYHEIAELRNVTYKTVSKHASNIFEKVGVNGKEALQLKLRDLRK